MSDAEVATEETTETTSEATTEETTEVQEQKTNCKDVQEAEQKTEETEKPKTIAEGAEEKTEEVKPPYWPDDWREKAAEHFAAGDKKAYDKELKRLGRVTDPAALYGMYRDAEAKLTSGKLLSIPGKDASEEDIAAFRKQLGWPEKAEEYFENVELENGAVIGDADKPVVDSFAAKMHEVGATQEQMNTALNWYFANQEEAAAKLDEDDENFKAQSLTVLKEELGAAFNRKRNSISSVFVNAVGGTDLENENSVFSRIMGGRTSDGKVIGNDPDVAKWLMSVAQEVNPVASVVDDGGHSGKGVDEELAEIAKFRKDNRRDYFKDEKMQARYRELLEAKAKMDARAT